MQFSTLASFFVLAVAATSANAQASGLSDASAIPQSAISYILESTGIDLTQTRKRSMKTVPLRMDNAKRDPVIVNGNCDQGQVQCCDSVASGKQANDIASLLDAQNLIGDVGINCVSLPISVIGVSGAISNQCKSTPVCCTNVTQNGLINLGCNALPIN